MKINIPKVVVPVELSGYAPELAGQQLQVWVNPPQDKLNEYNGLVTDLQQQELAAAKQVLLPEADLAEKESRSILRKTFDDLARMLKIRKSEKPQGLDVRMLAWYAEIWSQGPQDTQWTVDELRTLEQKDPAFLSWMISQTWQARVAHVERKKKS